jgi:hypothetical protein
MVGIIRAHNARFVAQHVINAAHPLIRLPVKLLLLSMVLLKISAVKVLLFTNASANELITWLLIRQSVKTTSSNTDLGLLRTVKKVINHLTVTAVL